MHVHVCMGMPTNCVCMCTCDSGKWTENAIMCVCLHFVSSNHPLCMCRTLCTPCRVWDIETGQLVNELLHHKDTVYSLKFTTKFLITGSSVSGTRLLANCSLLHVLADQLVLYPTSTLLLTVCPTL